MFEETFKKLGELSECVKEDARAAVKNAQQIIEKETTTGSSTKKVRIEHRDGHITIDGTYRSLTINGKKVR